MEPTRKRILVTGYVQGVGYRVLVRHIAMELGVKGCVGNLEDGSVEIYAEAGRKALDNFVNKINIKSDGRKIFAPNVKSITLFSEQDKNFRPVKNVFKPFWIMYGEKASFFEKEMMEKTEVATLMLSDVDLNVLGLRDETKAFRKETGDNFVSLRDETKAFRQENNENLVALKDNSVDLRSETHGNFSKLDVKYDSVSDYLKRINSNLEELNNTIKQVARKMLQ